jgi:hypothetical protein
LNPLWAGWPFLFAAAVVGGWRALQIVSAGWTAKQTERALHRHSAALKGITRGGH